MYPPSLAPLKKQTNKQKTTTTTTTKKTTHKKTPNKTKQNNPPTKTNKQTKQKNPTNQPNQPKKQPAHPGPLQTTKKRDSEQVTRPLWFNNSFVDEIANMLIYVINSYVDLRNQSFSSCRPARRCPSVLRGEHFNAAWTLRALFHQVSSYLPSL